MSEQLKAGDVVQLRSGGPKMVVAFVNEDGKYIKCVWHTDNGVVNEYNFPAEVLESISSIPSPG